MLDFVRQWVINIVALVFFIVVAEMLLPSGKMRKYAGLATGMILIIAIVNPLLGLTGKDFDFTAAQAVSSNRLNKTQVERDSAYLKKEQMGQIVEVYRANIIEKMEQIAQEVEGVQKASADVIINEDYNSSAFGEIKRAYLEITTNEGDGSLKTNEQGDGSLSKGRDGSLTKEGDGSLTKEGDGSPTKEGDGSLTKEGDGSLTKEGDGSPSQRRDGSPTAEIGRIAANIDEVTVVKIGKTAKKTGAIPGLSPELSQQLKVKISQVFGVRIENIIISGR